MTDSSLPQNDILASALRYGELGLSVIPVGRDKKPLIAWTRYQTERATPEQIKAWWSQFPDANVGIVTGAVSGIVVIDVEAGGSVEGLPFTAYCRTGGGGWHYYCKHPGKPVKNGVKVRPLTDIRGDGGFVVAPPSIHASGKPYAWDGMFPLPRGENIKALDELPDWALQSNPMPKPLLAELPIAYNYYSKEINEGQRNDTAIRLIGKVLHHNPPELWETLYPAIQSWNATCVKPPLTEMELRRTWESGIRMEGKKRTDTEEDAEVRPAVSFKELCESEFPDLKWAIESLFESGTINMISAAPNQYKSWVVQHMAICLARGEKVFGHFATDKQGVMIVNEEDPARLLKERSLMLVGQAEDIPVLFHVEDGIKMNEKSVDALIGEIKQSGVRFIIFDSLRSMHGADENSSTEMQRVMDFLKRFAREGITVLVTHHNRKKPRQPGMSRDELGEEARGSSAISGALHGHISCEPIEKDGKRCVVIRQQKLKGAKKLNPFLIGINESDGRFGFTYLGEYQANEDAVHKAKVAIADVLEQSIKWLSLKDLSTHDISGERTVRKALGELTAEGHIQSKTRKELLAVSAPMTGTDGKHNEKLYFHALVSDEDDPDP
ncbi:bifunctional DNA primase/polymerase [Candidatus Uhrbacteria bacterium]|nr:bifunctional DNA primase/polymerase [Candidatus Uhrbacteria bacterium]